MSTLARICRFLRLTDEQGRLSLTNIGMLIILVKLAMVAQTTVGDLGALFLSLAAYNGKRVLDHVKERAAANDVTAEHVTTLAAVKTEVQKLIQRASSEDTGRAMSKVLGK